METCSARLIPFNRPPLAAATRLWPQVSALVAALSMVLAGCEVGHERTDGPAATPNTNTPATLPSRNGETGQTGQTDGPLRADVVNVYGGAAAVAVSLEGGEERVIPWLAADVAVALPVSGDFAVSADGASAINASTGPSAAQGQQVVVYGQEATGLGVALLPPATSSVAQLRVLNASPHLGTGLIYTTGSALGDDTRVAPGELSPWRVLATDALSLASPIRVRGTLSERSFYVTLEHAITRPTTLIFATNAQRELVVVGLADNGEVFVQGPIVAPAEVRFAHFAAGVGEVTWTLDGEPVSTLAPRTTTEYVTTTPGTSHVVTAWKGQDELATTATTLARFEQRSLTLVGAPGGLSIVHAQEGEAERPWGSDGPVTLNIVDARAATATPAALYTRIIDTLDAATDWEPLVAQTTPSGLVTLTIDGAHHRLLGADLDGDGQLDGTFDVGGWVGAELIDLRLTVDDAQRPWVGVQWNNASSFAVPALERTTWLRIWNVDGGDMLTVTPEATNPIFGTWFTPVYPSSASGTVMVPDGQHVLTVGEHTSTQSFDGLTDVTLLARAGGDVLPVKTRHLVATSGSSLVFANLGDWAVAPSLQGGPSLGVLAPGSAGEELWADLANGGTLTLVGAHGEPLTFELPPSYGAGATILALSGDAAWPSLMVLTPGGYGPVAVHPKENTATLRVYAVFDGAGVAQVAVDGATVGALHVRTWGKAIVAAGGSGDMFVPAGEHTLTLVRGSTDTPGADITLSASVTLPPGTLTELMAFADGSLQVLPAMVDDNSARVINATSSAAGSSLYYSASGTNATLWVDQLLPHEVRVVPLPAPYGLASVDYDLDGSPDWKQVCGLSPASTVVVVGSDSAQAIAQFYGTGDYAVLQGTPVN